MFIDYTTIELLIITGLFLTSFELLRARALRTARAKVSRKSSLLLRDSAH